MGNAGRDGLSSATGRTGDGASGRRTGLAGRLAVAVIGTGALAALLTVAADGFRRGNIAGADLPALAIGIVGLTLAAFLAGHFAAATRPAGEPRPKPRHDGLGDDDILICRDLDNRITAVSDGVIRLFGAPPGGFVGLDYRDFVADLVAGRLVDPIGSGGETVSGRADPWKILRRRLLAIAATEPEASPPADGLAGDTRVETVVGPRWFAFADEPLTEAGVVVGLKAHGRDITARKAVEEALAVARDQAEAASAAKSRFLAMVSHEIRTPLNGILGMTGLIMQTQLTAEQRTYTRAVETSGEALMTLIGDLLDFSKIEAGRLDLQPAPLSLQTMVEELIELLAPRAFAKGIELAAYIDPGLPDKVIGDPARLRQILLNLAGNGIKFTAEGGVALEVLSAAEPAGAGRVAVLFQVRDTGIGIGAADQERVFGEFEQADPGPTRAYGGTGLGLAIARQLVRLMGSDISLQSAPGAGACFAFRLELGLDVAEPVAASSPAIAPPPPIADDVDDADEPATHARAALARLEASFLRTLPAAATTPPVVEPDYRVLTGRRILVVSHALIEGPMVLRRLFDAGADVTLATQKEIEVELAGYWRPDAILVDANAGDAVALIDRIRSVTDTPAGVLLAPNERSRLAELQQAGYGAYLVKPVRARSLIAVARALIGETELTPAESFVIGPPPPAAPVEALSVLLCDDNEINLLLGRAMMEKLGHRVTIAADGGRAIQLVDAALANGEALYDVILMDLHMPEVDGITAARHIRALLAARPDAGRHTRLVALTADAAPETRQSCDEGLFDDWLAKPLQPTDLEASLARAAELAHAS